MRTFDEFFGAIGFNEYPFAIFSAEGERRRLKDLFVKPAIYSPLVETFGNRSTVVVAGERGTGKTALIYEIIRGANKSSLNVYIEDFSDLRLDYSLDDLYDFLLNHLAEDLFKRLAEMPFALLKLSKDNRLLLSYLLKFHITQLSVARVEEKVRRVQLGPLKRIGLYSYNALRSVGNYSANAALAISSDIVRRHFPWLPPIDPNTRTEYFPALNKDSADPLQKAKANFALLGRVAALISQCGFERVLFILDKVDEEPRLENDAADIAEFLMPLLSDNKLLLHDGVQFLIACWSIPLDQLKSRVRFQKLSVQRVNWDAADLLRVLNQRLSTFSNGGVADVYAILDEDARPAFNEVISLANGNPRDLWHLMDAILRKQYELDSCAVKIGVDALGLGASQFVKGFNFYEYYPKASRARSDSMDVYSYIAHLLKLEGRLFTKNQLRDQAGTGGSTNNYVVAMENIGLVAKTDAKGPSGSVIYEIRDPKVNFAKDKGIPISR